MARLPRGRARSRRPSRSRPDVRSAILLHRGQPARQPPAHWADTRARRASARRHGPAHQGGCRRNSGIVRRFGEGAELATIGEEIVQREHGIAAAVAARLVAQAVLTARREPRDPRSSGRLRSDGTAFQDHGEIGLPGERRRVDGWPPRLTTPRDAIPRHVPDRAGDETAADGRRRQHREEVAREIGAHADDDQRNLTAEHQRGHRPAAAEPTLDGEHEQDERADDGQHQVEFHRFPGDAEGAGDELRRADR